VFALKDAPTRLAVIGAGPIGCELSQAFVRFGSQVTLIAGRRGLLPRDDRDAAAVLAAHLTRDGVRLVLDNRVREACRTADGQILLTLDGLEPSEVYANAVLVATGRRPRTEELGLEQAGVASDPELGISVNARLQTTNPRIYAAGDVCSALKFTHLSDAHARIIVRNALFFGRARADRLIIPWCTYTEPEVAQVGLTEHEADRQGISVKRFVVPFASVDRAVLDGDEEGFVKILVRSGTDRIVGATAVTRNAGEMIAEIAVVMRMGLGLSRVVELIHPYPTRAEAWRKAADAWNRERLTPRLRGVLSRLLAWRRS
jgi:pyruvate/2-oxoglutarate dehydrogenase complex dihydrolipoamide dehydrogenase (E3) component